MAGPRETGVTFVLGALDRFSAPFRAFNDRLESTTANLRRMHDSWGALNREGGRFAGLSGLSRLSSIGGNARTHFGEATAAAQDFAAKATVAAGVAGFAFKTQFLDTAAQFEQFETILTTLNRGDKGKAKEQLGWISDFAARTPYELAEVTDAFVKLRAYGMDPMPGLLKVLGDTASSMGKPLESAVEAIADAVTGENERLKEFGIKAAKEGGKIIYEYTDAAGKQSKMMAKASDRAQIQATLMKIWAEKYGGGMEAQSKTWNGMWSNMMDGWSRFSNMVMQNGVLDWMKDKLGGVLAEIDVMSSDGRLQAWAKDIGEKMVRFFDAAWEVLPKMWDGLQTLGDKLAWVAELLGGWDNLAIAAGALMSGLVGPILGLAAAFLQLSLALVATPFGWVVLAIGGLVAAITALWLKWDAIIKWAKEALPDWMVNGASAVGDFFSAQKGVFAPAGASSPAQDGEGAPSLAARPSLGAGETMRRVQEQRFQSLERQEKQSTLTIKMENVPRGTEVRQTGEPVPTDITYMGLAAPAH
ncbi:hypothetical protein FVW20_00250 [Desulfovibrio oxamicus]|uniref:Tape measure protein N-terminal domain-containing protein n=1 Tax=Nitratidesulfovibrio oxamicus TaxID=32016 RepID=A0ABS0IZW1_9BACT|nr:tape measure protein [Nitratidesulfovibrio oxamicus]MBG3875495.1 hypothetical protein [Nitratidesulfovibrio oxamicus]